MKLKCYHAKPGQDSFTVGEVYTGRRLPAKQAAYYYLTVKDNEGVPRKATAQRRIDSRIREEDAIYYVHPMGTALLCDARFNEVKETS